MTKLAKMESFFQKSNS